MHYNTAMSDPITLIDLFRYGGPNILGPQPGVRLLLRCDRDRSQRVRAAIKDGALTIGLVIAYLEVQARPLDGAYLLEAAFTSDRPDLGAALCEYLVAGLNAQLGGDTGWEGEGPLEELRERSRREALPMPALQLIAEARRRELPVLRRPDGLLQLGYGARGWACDPAHIPVAIPWEQIGAIPLSIVTGGPGRAAALRRAADELAAAGLHPTVRDGADFAATINLLADQQVTAAAIGLDADAILRHGVAFDRCDQALVSDGAGPRPPAARDDEEWVRALGVPMLLCAGPARLNLADPALRPLIPHAPRGVVDLGQA